MGAINFNNGLGIHDNALLVRAKRAEVLANNMANADTPGFKARDINFRAILAAESQKESSLSLQVTQQGHIAGNSRGDDSLLYRLPNQPAIDGNTVETQVEQAIYARNAMSYNASFEFLNSKFKGMRNALRGE
ncbi:flagellar basal body rod protein FlgB [Bacterioplanes sanyensis]|uniref:Flagellar basal body rod protein FlgB n=1 Tax=Bacterioplanes sanyensis TaxID=1249553 RepID=A0A222FQW2_9GAMM|nr:flagellar basal body rod protein FlgB [Bacterioplanes sanyensis]ASP40623.1 flagellar basal body rod protein FlgB [Bacterioplanes sanyensis]